MEHSQNDSLKRRAFHAALTHEWTDRFEPEFAIPLSEALRRSGDALPELPIQSEFFAEAADLATRHLSERESVLEVGGAFGRFAWELSNRWQGIDEYHLSEPDGEKVQWLHDHLREPWFDQLSKILTLHQAPLAGLLALREKFPLVVCLNVIDHLANPLESMEQLLSLTTHDGALLVASPLDWHDSLTKNEHQVEDLKELLPSCTRVYAETSALFPIRSRKKRLIVFESQVLIVGKS